MANKDQIVGFRPYGKVRSAQSYTTSAIVYPGDAVQMDNAGLVAPAAASSTIFGVALSYAASGGQCLVCDDPDQQYVVQADDGTVSAQTSVGLNFNITVGTASTLYKRSAMELDASTGATDSTLPLRLLGVQRGIDNELGANVDLVVRINKQQLGPSTEGL
jgi:hypothetical protein